MKSMFFNTSDTFNVICLMILQHLEYYSVSRSQDICPDNQKINWYVTLSILLFGKGSEAKQYDNS